MTRLSRSADLTFAKYQALGNDYIVVTPDMGELTHAQITALCHRHYGIGSDGILFGPETSEYCDFKLRIFNPDGSEAEKSGNGLRIFARYLWDQKLVGGSSFSIETKGGRVEAKVHDSGQVVTVDMGQVRFTHGTDHNRPLTEETIVAGDKSFVGYRASVGNPHFVIPVTHAHPDLALTYGPLIEKHSVFSQGTNVQFVQPIDKNKISIQIWERGAGYTLASGSSSSAAAGVAHQLGWCEPKLQVLMPGGRIDIQIDRNRQIKMTGGVGFIGQGVFAEEAINHYISCG